MGERCGDLACEAHVPSRMAAATPEPLWERQENCENDNHPDKLSLDCAACPLDVRPNPHQRSKRQEWCDKRNAQANITNVFQYGRIRNEDGMEISICQRYAQNLNA